MFEFVKAVSIFLAAFMIGCGGMYSSDDAESDVDVDVGLGSTYEDQNSAGEVHDDPCADDNSWDCDPVSNAGCADAGVDLGCGLYSETTSDGGVAFLGFYCLTDATGSIGSICNQEIGPWCIGGATCVTFAGETDGACAAYCCEQGDCAAAETCTQGNWPGLNSLLGYCAP